MLFFGTPRLDAAEGGHVTQTMEETALAADEAVGSVDWTQQTSGSFDDLEIPETVRLGIRELGFTAPTPVQRAVFAAAAAGDDLVIQSKTGSGKTAAFGVPVAARLEPPGRRPQALVLAPTRELVQQVDREIGTFVKYAGHETVVVIGGVGYGPQQDALDRGASVVVGTPGRVLDHIRKGTFDTSGVRMVVLDEADEMLSMGFWEEVTAILDRMPRERQTMLLSATLPPEIDRAAKRYLKEPTRIELTGDVSIVLGVENILYLPLNHVTPARNLLYLLEVEKPTSALIFCNTKNEAAGIAVYLRRFGFRVDGIHGDLSQRDRERAMGRLRQGEVDLLVATDIAARGIDISDLSHVVNFGLPDYPEVYVHRVGRTGRIGKKGTAITLLSGQDMGTASAVQKRYGVTFQNRALPNEEEIIRMQSERIVAQVLEAASDVEFEMYVPIALEMCKTEEGRRAVGYLLREYFSEGPARGARGGAAAADGGAGHGVRLYVAAGLDEAGDDELRAALLAVEGVEEADVFSLERQAASTFVQMSAAAADRVLDAHGLTVGDRTFKVERARSGSGGSGGSGGRGGDRGRGGGGRGGDRGRSGGGSRGGDRGRGGGGGGRRR
jgi:ATP-dependent RNA helicase DeaD